jgi:multidrug efflux pump subunit AcrB
MQQKVSSFSIILAFTCLSLAGLALVPLLPVKLSPSEELPRISVHFSMPGNSARVVEMEATGKLEAMLSRIKGIRNISSTSGNGWGRIAISLDRHVSIDVARFEVSTVIRQTWPDLPQGVSYPGISVSRSDEESARPFMNYTVNAPAAPVLIRQFAEERIKAALSQMEGIGRIDVRGAMPMVWQLEYDAQRLSQAGISLGDVQAAIERSLQKEFLGTVSIEGIHGSRQWIRIALAPSLPERELDFEGIVIKEADGKLITLGEVARISRQEKQAGSYYRINGLNSIYLSVYSDEQANQLELSERIRERIGQLKAAFPAGYEMHLNYDATEYIREELGKIYFRSGLTLLILLIFILLIYRNMKYLLLIASSLAVNMAVAVIFYYLFRLEMQLYSLAGITISLTLVIDNTIVMSEQMLRRKNRKVFPAIFAATLTTIASLAIIFFLEEKIRLNLLDFACVLIINLAVSLLVALFFVPALIERLNISVRSHAIRRFRRIPVHLNRFYAAGCVFIRRRRIAVIILLVLGFGLPVFLLPDNVKGDGTWAKLYNRTLGSSVYKEKIKPYGDKILGGSLRLFVQKVYEGSYFVDRQETSLHVTATLPNGSTVEQMNVLIGRMENYISRFPEVRQFRTSVENARRASIDILFGKEHQRSAFPYMLKSRLIGKSQELGGGSWSVYGLGEGFSNDVRESAGSYRVQLYGFNYDELYDRAERFKAKLLEHRRIKEVTINSEFSWYKDDYEEFVLDIDRERSVQSDLRAGEIFGSLKHVFGRDISTGYVPGDYGSEQLLLQSRQSREYDRWSLEHIPLAAGEKDTKLTQFAAIGKSMTPQNIVKENQQYRLCLQYEYIGAWEQGKKALKSAIESFREELPMGYTIESREQRWGWGSESKSQYGLLLLIFVIIYFTAGVLFNSLRQPLAVISVIPIAFIGIFLTFYLFGLNFDQGGFAAFVLLCGISVNSNIYVLNEYSNIRRKNGRISPLKAYIKALNVKIMPIFLTAVSTILGFIPFMTGDHREAFWFPLAAGTIGGLITSLIGTFCFLPLFMRIGK